jgi:2-dehydropantoate 2-reductase
VDEAIAEAYDHKPSMLQDVLARRATEIDVLNGGIAAEGRRVGVPTPLHDCMVALVKASSGPGRPSQRRTRRCPAAPPIRDLRRVDNRLRHLVT